MELTIKGSPQEIAEVLDKLKHKTVGGGMKATIYCKGTALGAQGGVEEPEDVDRWIL